MAELNGTAHTAEMAEGQKSQFDVLVDGAVMKNFPADVMRASQLGPIVGVDVSGERNITADDVARPESAWRWIRSGEWRKGPPIVSLLMRAATVSTGRDLAAAREATDVDSQIHKQARRIGLTFCQQLLTNWPA